MTHRRELTKSVNLNVKSFSRIDRSNELFSETVLTREISYSHLYYNSLSLFSLALDLVKHVEFYSTALEIKKVKEE